MYFNLKHPNADKATLIILRYQIGKTEGRFVYSTGEKVHPKDWNRKDKMPNQTRGRADLAVLSRDLREYSECLENALLEAKKQRIKVTKQYLKECLDNRFVEKENEFIYFTDWIDHFVRIAHKVINRTTNKYYSERKIRNYKKAGNRLKEFEKHRGKRIRLDGFTIKVYDEFIVYLKDLDYAVNTIGDFIKLIVPMLKKASEDYTVSKDYELKEFAVVEEETVAIVLNEDEIQQIFEHDFSDSPMLLNCRNIAIIGLWTGLRGGDFLNLPEIDPEKDFIEVLPSKTKHISNDKVVIPLHKHVKSILRRFGMPHKISDTNFNKYIKRVCEIAGINSMCHGSVMVKREDGKLRKKVGVYPKYMLVSSHTCRRSFATNLYKSNFPSISIMKITGHKTEKNFLKYIKVTPTEHAQKLLDHWNNYYKD